MDEKQIRTILYALHTIELNWDDDTEDDLNADGIDLTYVKEYARKLENQLEEIQSRK